MNSLEDASDFSRRFSFRKKKWPDDYVDRSIFRKTLSPSFFSHFCSSSSPPLSPSHEFTVVLTSRGFAELRAQFTDQSKCLDAKLDIDSMVLAELQEFYRRRATVEQDYSDALAKLANSLQHKHLNEIAKRAAWTNYTTASLWNTLLGSTLHLSDAHATLAEVFSKQMVQRLSDMDEDAIRLHRQCREMMHRCQEKVLANTSKLQSDQREYGQRQSAQSDADRIQKRSEEKLTLALNHVQAKKKDQEKSQRFKRAKADFDQKHQVFENTVVATNRSRNEYLIQLKAANQSITRYFTDEVSDIIDCMNCGFHNSLARTAMMHLSCEESIKMCHNSVGEKINRNISALDWRHDKALFLRRNEAAFSRPPGFSFIPYKDDQEMEVSTVAPLRENLEATSSDLKVNLNNINVATEKAWNQLQEIEKKLLMLINQNDYDVSELFTVSGKRQRPRSGSLGNGPPTQAGSPVSLQPTTSFTNPLLPPSISATTTSSSSASIPVGMNKVGGGSGMSTAVSGSNLSSEGGLVGSQASVFRPQQPEMQQGLYLTLRSSFRESRINTEKEYMERFAAYTQEMHRYYVMTAKLSEIERALAKSTRVPNDLHVATPPPMHHFPSVGVPILTSIRENSPTQSSHHLPHGLSFSDPMGEHMTQLASAGLTSAPPPPPPPPPCTSLTKMAPRRVLRVPNIGRPKLFGATIDEYVSATKEEIPRIVISCIRVINLYGMHHQGVFRVSGSQSEITAFKTTFEYGLDPLIGLSDARDINSTAGLLKLYFRELGEPPFPPSVFIDLIKAVHERGADTDDFVHRLSEVVSQDLSRPVFIVMRYLFAFLNHLSEYSDENLMDPYNLAICFGPTLMPVPADFDQVEHQASVNDLVKHFIVHHNEIFDPAVAGPRYDRYFYAPQVSPRTIARLAVQEAQHRLEKSSASLSVDEEAAVACLDSSIIATPPPLSPGGHREDCSGHQRHTNLSRSRNVASKSRGVKPDDLNSLGDQLSLDEDDEDDDDAIGDELRGEVSDSGSEDFSEFQPVLAVTQSDFVGGSPRELSFRRGVELRLFRQLNDHWWEGQLASMPSVGQRYLVPHLYVAPTTVSPAANPKVRKSCDHSPRHESSDKLALSSSSSFAVAAANEVSSPPAKPPRTVTALESDGNRSGGLKTENGTPIETASSVAEPSTILESQASTERPNTLTISPIGSDTNEPILDCMTRSLSNLPSAPSSNILCRSFSSPTNNSHHRGSWAGSPSALAVQNPPNNSMITPTITNTILEPLPEDRVVVASRPKPPNIEHSLSVDESVNSNHHSHMSFDSDLAEVIHDLEQGHSSTGEMEVIREQRSREMERKMRIPSVVKHSTPDLVLDLPDEVGSWEYPQNNFKHHTLSSAADTFAEEDCGTVRKRIREAPRTRLQSNTSPIIEPAIDNLKQDKDSRLEQQGIEKNEVAIKRISIAARVAAFEASNVNSAAQSVGPSRVRKT